MKAAALIKEVRESTQHLYDSYQKYLETDGKMGLCCFDPDLLEERLKRSDRDVIEQGLAKVFILRMPKNTLPSLAGESQCVRKENIYDTGKD